MTPEELEGVLRDAASSPAPTPRPAFTDALELRLRSLDTSVRPSELHRPRALRRAAPAAMALLVAAALVAVALLPQGTKARIERVPSTIAAEPNTEATTTSTSVASTSTSTSISTSTSVASGPAVTVRRQPTPTTSTTAVGPRADTTTTTTTAVEAPPRPTTTTTAPPDGVQDLQLSCVASGGSSAPAITCRWARTASDRFASYRLIRHTGDGPEQVVSTGSDRGPTSVGDPAARFGARLFYVVTALAADGTVLGRSETPLVTCC